MRSTPTILGSLLVTLVIGTPPARAQGTFPQPKRARFFKVSLGPAIMPCSAPDKQTQSGVAGCTPRIFSENGVEAWSFSPTEGLGTFEIKPKGRRVKEKGERPDPALNPQGETGDVELRLVLRGVTEGGVLANGPGTLRLHLRLTFDDRVNGDITLPDTTAEIPFPVVNGKATLRRSLGRWMNDPKAPLGGHPSLPRTFRTDILGFEVLDENGLNFAPIPPGWYPDRPRGPGGYEHGY
jgi:hypothetical protein